MTTVVNNITGGTIKGALIQGKDFTFAGPISIGSGSDAQDLVTVAEPETAVEARVGLSGPEARQIAGALRHFAGLDANIGLTAQSHADTLTNRADEGRDGVLLSMLEAQQIVGLLLHFAPLDENIGIVAAGQAEMLTLRRVRIMKSRTA